MQKISFLLTRLLFFTFLYSCSKAGNITSSLYSGSATDPNNAASKGAGTGSGGAKGKTVNVCNSTEASNYNAGTVAAGEVENCLFVLCTDASKVGFKKDIYTKYFDYISAHGGSLKNDDKACGDNVFSNPSSDTPFPSGFQSYHTYGQYVTEVNDLIKKYPDLVSMASIGKSSQGLALMMIKVSTDQQNADTHPTLLITGTHHAREHLSTETPLLLLKNFLEKASKDQSLRDSLKTKTIYFIPLLNPDGAIYDLKGGNFQFWRKNTRNAVPGSGNIGVDLNRNYDSHFGGEGSSSNTSSDVYHGPSAFSEPETQALRDFITNHQKINFIVTYHSFSELVLYPWGGVTAKMPDPDYTKIKTISEKIASITGYKPMQSSALYVATGDLCDWSYEKYQKFCITIELTPTQSAGNNGFYPPNDTIQKVLQLNIPVLDYLYSIVNDPRTVK